MYEKGNDKIILELEKQIVTRSYYLSSIFCTSLVHYMHTSLNLSRIRFETDAGFL